MTKKDFIYAAVESVSKTPGLENGRHLTGRGYMYIRRGLKHRERGPAEVWNDGYKAWYFKGQRHRRGGPAVIYPDGRQEWWENGKLLKVVDPTKTAPGTKIDMRAEKKRHGKSQER